MIQIKARLVVTDQCQDLREMLVMVANLLRQIYYRPKPVNLLDLRAGFINFSPEEKQIEVNPRKA